MTPKCILVVEIMLPLRGVAHRGWWAHITLLGLNLSRYIVRIVKLHHLGVVIGIHALQISLIIPCLFVISVAVVVLAYPVILSRSGTLSLSVAVVE